MSAPRPRLAMVITRLVAGGAQKVVLDLVRGLGEEFEIHLVSGTSTGPEGSFWDTARLLLPAERVHVCPALVRNPNPVLDLLAYIQLRRIFRRIRPDIVHTHTSKAGVLGRLAARSAGVPRVVHSTHGLVFDPEARIPGVSGHWLLLRLLQAVEARAGRCSDAIVCLSEKEVGDALRLRLGPARAFCCIPNGIELDDYAAIPRPPGGWGSRQVRIGTAGRLSTEKGQELLIRAFKRLCGRWPNLLLDIAGDGPLEASLRRTCASLGVQDHVVFHGFRRDMTEYMASLDIFALSSHYEGFGLVLVEAMAAGLPVVATDVGGVGEVLDGGKAGVVVPAGSVPELVMGIEYFLQNPHQARQYGDKGRRRALEHYSLRHMLDAHRRVYLPAPPRPAPDAEEPEEGLFPVDLHMHSEFSFDCETDVDDILERALELGLKAVAITDHDELEGSLLAASRAPDGLVVVPGMEVSTEAGDIIGLFLTEPVRSKEPLAVLAEIHAQGGIAYLPHPFRGRTGIPVDLLAGIDAVEILNGRTPVLMAGEVAFGEREVADFARAHKKTGLGGSDAHTLDEVGRVRTLLPPFRDAAELRALLAGGRLFPVRMGETGARGRTPAKH